MQVEDLKIYQEKGKFKDVDKFIQHVITEENKKKRGKVVRTTDIEARKRLKALEELQAEGKDFNPLEDIKNFN